MCSQDGADRRLFFHRSSQNRLDSDWTSQRHYAGCSEPLASCKCSTSGRIQIQRLLSSESKTSWIPSLRHDHSILHLSAQAKKVSSEASWATQRKCGSTRIIFYCPVSDRWMKRWAAFQAQKSSVCRIHSPQITAYHLWISSLGFGFGLSIVMWCWVGRICSTAYSLSWNRSPVIAGLPLLMRLYAGLSSCFAYNCLSFAGVSGSWLTCWGAGEWSFLNLN